MTYKASRESSEGVLADGGDVRIALVDSRFNASVTNGLLEGAERCLDEHGCGAERRTVVRVPGAWEIPQAAQKLVRTGRYDAVLGLGALIRGETPHFDHLASAVSHALARVGLDSGVPTVFGVLTTETVEQAVVRSSAGPGNKGREAALAALEMVALFRDLDGRDAG